MRAFVRLVIFMACFSFALVGMAKPGEAVLPDSQTQALAQLALDGGILRAQIDQMRGFQDSVLNLAWWALSVVAAVALGLISFSWWNNSRNYERDKNSIRDEITNQLEKRIALFETQVIDRLQKSDVDLFDRVNKFADEFTAEMSAKREAAIEEVRQIVTKSAQEASMKIAKLEMSHKPVRTDLLDLTRKVYEIKGYPSMKLLLSSELLEDSFGRSDFFIERAISYLAEDIKPFEAKDLFVPEQFNNQDMYFQRIRGLLEKVPDALKAMAQDLVERIDAIPPRQVAPPLPPAPGLGA
jgi:hypothetical protein